MGSFKHHVAVCLLWVLAAGQPLMANAAHAQPETAGDILEVGSARALAGAVARGVIRVPPGTDAGYDIPVIVVNGAKPGPTLALIGGLHGAEFASIVALQTLSARLEPSRLAGRLIIVPLVNVAGFDAITRHLNPVDQKNMNRVFPGMPDGTQSERAAHVVTTEVIHKADYVVDYHGGDLDEAQQPYAYWIRTGESRIDDVEYSMLRAFGSPFLIKFDATTVKPATSKLLPLLAVSLGKPTITVDAGRAGTVGKEDVDLLIDGTTNLMAHLKMLSTPAKTMADAVIIERTVYVNSEASGTFVPLARYGQYVEQGQKIGHVTDRYGMPAADVIAPESAVVLYLNSTPSAAKGGQLFFLGIPAKADAPDKR